MNNTTIENAIEGEYRDFSEIAPRPVVKRMPPSPPPNPESPSIRHTRTRIRKTRTGAEVERQYQIIGWSVCAGLIGLCFLISYVCLQH